MLQHFPRLQTGMHFEMLKDDNNHALKDVWILDNLTDYDADYFQLAAIADGQEYLILYKKDDKIDFSHATTWFKLDPPQKYLS